MPSFEGISSPSGTKIISLETRDSRLSYTRSQQYLPVQLWRIKKIALFCMNRHTKN